MSNYIRVAKNPLTGMWEGAEFVDDHYGKHKYGVRFGDGRVYPEEEIESKNHADYTAGDHKLHIAFLEETLKIKD